MTTRHIAGLAVWLVVIALIVLGASSRTALARPFYLTAGLVGGLSLLAAMSSLWSGSAELSVIEADRLLVYLGAFLATFLIAQTGKRRQRFAEGLTIAIALVALLALGSRLAPGLIEAGVEGEGARLRYPLRYWNADGALFGIGVALLLWSSRRAAWDALRRLSVAAIPVLLLALYFTYSRGGVLALAIAAGCTIALSRDRLWILATLAIGALGALPAVLAVQARREIADNVAGQAAVDQGVTVLLFLLAGVGLALALFAALRRLEARGGGRTRRAIELSRDPRLLRAVAAAAAVVAIGVTIAIGGRAWDQFNSTDIQFPDRPEQHFSNLSGAGRGDFYRVAIDAFGEKPVLGSGAGTYEFAWEQNRTIEIPLHDAHSLYLEAFAELGLLGGLLTLALIATVLWTGFAAWRAAAHPQRELYGVLFAAALAFAVGAGLDWFWEIAALGAVFLLLAGLLVAARCAQLVPGAEQSAAAPDSGEGRFGLAVAGLAVAWIAMVALIGPLLVERELDASQSAAAEGNIAKAIDHAETARSIEPFAASPYVQLALIAELQGDFAAAAERLTQAIDREDRSWQLYYLRSRVEGEAGNAAAAGADFAQARRLNPRAPELQAGRP
ncbi:MAG: O-antigen ligase family protein [Solirubrobacterales bacterium]